MDQILTRAFMSRPPTVGLGGYQAPSFPLVIRAQVVDTTDVFPQLAMVRAAMPPNVAESGSRVSAPGTLPELPAAVVPQGLGRIKRFPNHQSELEAMTAACRSVTPDFSPKKEAAPRSQSINCRDSRRVATPATVRTLQVALDPYTSDLPRTSPTRIPAHYLTRKRKNIPGVVRIRGEKTPETTQADFSQSTYTSRSASKRGESPMTLQPASMVSAQLYERSGSPTKQEFFRRSAGPTAIQSYEGEYRASKRQGKGTAVYRNGDVYSGQWEDNDRSGRGEFRVKANGAVYSGEWRGDKQSGTGIVTFANGDQLEAKWSGGELVPDRVEFRFAKERMTLTSAVVGFLPEGEGDMTYQSGARFHGMWAGGSRHGHGTLAFPSGDSFEGCFVNDYTQGPGRLILRKSLFLKSDLQMASTHKSDRRKTHRKSSGSTSESTVAFPDLSDADTLWKTLSEEEIAQCSQLRRCLPQGKMQAGSFIAGKLNGYLLDSTAVAQYGTRATYYGEFKDGLKCGFGSMTYTNSNYSCLQFPEADGTYEGEWKKDRRHGHGRMRWRSGLVYEGQFRKDHRHMVTGAMWFPTGERYEGQWAADLMHGVGTLTSADGDVFRGKFTCGNMAREGQLHFPDGMRYQGEVRGMRPTGRGKLEYPSKEVYEGDLHNGNRVGQGKMKYRSGDLYTGEWKDDQRDGFGTLVYSATSERYEGGWVRDRRQGFGTLTNSTGGVIYSGSWRDDEMEGSGQLFQHDL